jgi:hypothetical protein
VRSGTRGEVRGGKEAAESVTDYPALKTGTVATKTKNSSGRDAKHRHFNGCVGVRHSVSLESLRSMQLWASNSFVEQ